MQTLKNYSANIQQTLTQHSLDNNLKIIKKNNICKICFDPIVPGKNVVN